MIYQRCASCPMGHPVCAGQIDAAACDLAGPELARRSAWETSMTGHRRPAAPLAPRPAGKLPLRELLAEVKACLFRSEPTCDCAGVLARCALGKGHRGEVTGGECLACRMAARGLRVAP